MRRHRPSVPDPSMVDDSALSHCEEVPSFDEIDRAVLEGCGYREGSEAYSMIYEGVVGDSDERKIFTVDRFRSYGIDDAVDEVLKDEVFDEYWHESIYDRLSDEDDGELLEQWTPEFMGEELKKYLSTLKKVERLNYQDFFRHILEKSRNPDAVDLIDFDDGAFDGMPTVMRLY